MNLFRTFCHLISSKTWAFPRYYIDIHSMPVILYWIIVQFTKSIVHWLTNQQIDGL